MIAALLAASGLHAHADSCIWYADDDSIRQVQTSTNQTTRVVPFRAPHRLIMNAEDCGVWVLDKLERTLLRFNAEGAFERLIHVADLGVGLDVVDRLHVNPYDGSLWITDNWRVAHVSAGGELLGNFAAPGEVRRMAVALDQTLWLLGKKDLWRFDAKGTLLASYPLGRHLIGDARYFAVDSLAGLIWLVDDNNFARFKLADPMEEPPLQIQLQHQVTGLALDPLAGNVWVAQSDSLLAFSQSGAVVHQLNLPALSIFNAEKLGFDPVSRSVWVGAQRSLSRFTDAGQFVTRFVARDGDEALGVPAFRVQPTLTLVRPPQEALANNPQPEFRLGYGAECNAASCGFPGAYFRSYELSATLNNQQVGSFFIFDPNSVESSFTPSSRLPEGENSFSAQVTDRFGHRSNTISNMVTVDTIAPQFLALSPADGAVLQVPQALLQGTVDDPLATVVLENLGLTQTGASFSFPVTLQPGPNIFRISAIDRAGNSVTAQRTLNLASLSVSITSPVSGATVSGSSVLVTGTIQGPPNTGVTVNGVVAAIIADRFYARVPIQTGPNVLTVIAKTQDGFTVQQALSVTGSGPVAIEISATPQSGLAPFKAKFKFNLSVGTSVSTILADLDGNGSIDFTTTDLTTPTEFTYPQPGVFQATFIIRHTQGNTTVQTLQVVVQDPNQLDAQLKAVWSGFVSKLVARDKAAAMQHFSASAGGRYGPVFDALLPDLPQIAASFSPPLRAELGSAYAEYAVVRVIGGVKRVYMIQFVVGADGVWRIDSM